MNTDTIKQQDLILGYKLTRKLGSGGYGDVWEAEAPGGLKKAVKIIYGFHDEKRAQGELKALDRIKEARHPFLLSLERIEIHNSKLIIVSELADKSLADLVNEYCDRDQSGIPRDELIGYMRDAADALDYLNTSFGLQHLDIKPENLLLVSGHAKVADFGLVKDLHEATQSLMSGMTPAYAAPELFDGQPGSASDQYSLATVYQEMLTTVRPFPGTTPAQLAAQHMHGKPDLRTLPISDQPVISKALSKDPNDRYKSCKQFVEQLSNRKTRKRIIKTRATTRSSIDTGGNTVDLTGVAESRNQTELFSDSRLTFNSVELESVDPPECDPANAQFQPTVVIGIGNSSSRVLQKIKQRIVARHGDSDLLPSFSILCIDSDRDSLAQLSMGRDTSSIKVNETLAIPLRRSEQYRQRKNLDLSWIGRRWIYNVPRSLQTEGLRPLGRLVFVDHFENICKQISTCIKQVMQPENIANTCETLGLNPPREICPRIVIVANISGGLGSGMTNDLAYTVRLMVAEQGIQNCELVGMLMYGNEAVGREAGLSTANAYAFLTELRHFADGGYPGDNRIGIPEFEDDLPFDHAYGLKLAADKESQVASGLDKIAEYICLSNTTSCGVFIDACRKKDKEQEEFGFRSFGISVCGPGLQIQGQDAVGRLSKSLIDQWISEPPSGEFSAESFAMNCMSHFQLDLEHVTANTAGLIFQLEEWQIANSSLEQASSKLAELTTELKFQDIDTFYDDLFDAPHWRKESLGTATELCLAAENEISVEAHQRGDGLSTRILELLNGNCISFSRTANALKACQDAIAQQRESTTNGLHAFGTTMQHMRRRFEELTDNLGMTDVQTDFNASFIKEYGQLRFQEFALRCSSDHYRVIKSCLSSTEEMIKKFRMQLEAVGQGFDAKQEPKRSARYAPTIQQMLVESVESHRDELVGQVEQLVFDSIDREGDQFLDVLSDSLNWQQHLPFAIKEAAQSVLSAAFKKISLDQVISENKIQPAALKTWLNEQMNEATPFVTDCGGGAALMLGQAQNSPISAIPKTIDDCFDVKLKAINGTTGDFVLCFEAERLLLANIAFSVLKEAPEATEIAKRIPSRNDIDWTTLDDLL